MFFILIPLIFSPVIATFESDCIAINDSNKYGVYERGHCYVYDKTIQNMWYEIDLK